VSWARINGLQFLPSRRGMVSPVCPCSALSHVVYLSFWQRLPGVLEALRKTPLDTWKIAGLTAETLSRLHSRACITRSQPRIVLPTVFDVLSVGVSYPVCEPCFSLRRFQVRPSHSRCVKKVSNDWLEAIQVSGGRNAIWRLKPPTPYPSRYSPNTLLSRSEISPTVA
jgi:hypothetical protein